MSRASGAGAYSHGIAWPSPSPQLDAASDERRHDRDPGVGGHREASYRSTHAMARTSAGAALRHASEAP